MPAFCGQDRILIDANGRFKLPPRLIEDFLADGNGDVVFYCLPEGALAIYPEKIYAQMRQREADDIRLAGMSMLKRRDLRRFGAWSASAQITPQGRLTLPQEFRQPTLLDAGCEAIVIGVEIGVEIWNLKRWQDELKLINDHEIDRGDLELTQDLNKLN
jgi:DNA-binding transcriptional regulator/RsmH inhibitor MraZ